MADRVLPRYPVYVPSKGRWDSPFTATLLAGDGVPFRLVVEPQERDKYAKQFGPDKLLVLPQNDRGLIYARNWIKEHSIAAGDVRHWQLDDNIQYVSRVYRNRRMRCESGVALAATEDFVDRYDNVAIAGLNYHFFVRSGKTVPPFYVNAHVYSCTLVLNSIPYRWRSYLNDDTDMCLQVLAGGWCTVAMNAFLVRKMQTMIVRGGNTGIYQGDGRLKMARALERMWPGVVETKRRFRRPQHVVKDAWRRFDTPLKLKPGVDLAAMEPNEYGMRLTQVKPVKSERLRKLLEAEQA